MHLSSFLCRPISSKQIELQTPDRTDKLMGGRIDGQWEPDASLDEHLGRGSSIAQKRATYVWKEEQNSWMGYWIDGHMVG